MQQKYSINGTNRYNQIVLLMKVEVKNVEELIEKAKNKDKEAFTELILDMQKELYCIAKMKLQNEEDICDIIQETMLSAFKDINKLKENKYFKTWIIKILINKCNKMYRKQRWMSLEENESYNYIVQEDKNDKIDFDILIKDLSNQEKTIMTLYYYLGYTTKEISKILNIREGTIRSKISRAKIKIKNQYKGEFK